MYEFRILVEGELNICEGTEKSLSVEVLNDDEQSYPSGDQLRGLLCRYNA